MTRAEIDEIVTRWAQEIAQQIKDGDVCRDQPHDAIFETVDSGWGELGFPVGRIDQWPIAPKPEVLILLGNVLEYCQDVAWIEDDSGLWEGYHGAAVMAAQAFFSLENVLWEKLRYMNVID
jgi:hypothetical protein